MAWNAKKFANSLSTSALWDVEPPKFVSETDVEFIVSILLASLFTVATSEATSEVELNKSVTVIVATDIFWLDVSWVVFGVLFSLVIWAVFLHDSKIDLFSDGSSVSYSLSDVDASYSEYPEVKFYRFYRLL